jgi:hypothetical protein
MEHLSPEVQELHQRMEKRVRELEERKARLERATTSPVSNDKGRKPATHRNPFVGLHRLLSQCKETHEAYGYPLWLDDVLQGVARLDWYRKDSRSIPLSVRNMLRLLGYLPCITTAHVAALLLIENRQAQRYVQALRIAIPRLVAAMPQGTLELIAELKQQEEEFDLWWDEASETAADAYIFEAAA